MISHQEYSQNQHQTTNSSVDHSQDQSQTINSKLSDDSTIISSQNQKPVDNLQIKSDNQKLTQIENINRLLSNDSFLKSENAIIVLDFDNIHENSVLDISGRGNDAKIRPPIDIVFVNTFYIKNKFR